MMLVEVTAVPDGALPLEEFKAHLRAGSGFSADSLQEEVLRGFLRAACSAVEGRTGKILLARDFTWTVARWRDGRAEPFPVAPVIEVLDVVSVSRDGDENAIAPERWWLEADGSQPQLRARGDVLPTVPTQGSFRIAFRAGMAETWGALPADIAQAVLMLAAHYYAFREATGLGEGCVPFGVAVLLERYRAMRLLGGSSR